MTVLTSRRAVLLGAAPVPGRLRLSDRALRFEPLDGPPVEIESAAVRAILLQRRVLVVESADRTLRLRCFGVEGVAGLLLHACTRPESRAIPVR